jgi:hypothetical protein
MKRDFSHYRCFELKSFNLGKVKRKRDNEDIKQKYEYEI